MNVQSSSLINAARMVPLESNSDRPSPGVPVLQFENIYLQYTFQRNAFVLILQGYSVTKSYQNHW